MTTTVHSGPTIGERTEWTRTVGAEAWVLTGARLVHLVLVATADTRLKV